MIKKGKKKMIITMLNIFDASEGSHMDGSRLSSCNFNVQCKGGEK